VNLQQNVVYVKRLLLADHLMGLQVPTQAESSEVPASPPIPSRRMVVRAATGGRSAADGTATAGRFALAQASLAVPRACCRFIES
jgi:hypothetical protein